MNFCHVTINVKNMEASLRFYRDIVGLPVTGHGGGGGTEIVFLGGETKVELICSPGRSAGSYGSDISIGFEVDSLDAARQLLAEGGITDVGPDISPNPGVKFFFFPDPDGVRIQFLENVKQ